MEAGGPEVLGKWRRNQQSSQVNNLPYAGPRVPGKQQKREEEHTAMLRGSQVNELRLLEAATSRLRGVWLKRLRSINQM